MEQPIMGSVGSRDLCDMFDDGDYGATYNRNAPMRASYAPTSSSPGGKLLGADGGRMRRAKSMPVLTRDELAGMVPFPSYFFTNYYVSKAGTMTSSCFNLVSATLGAGVLALPSAMAHSGIALGIGALIVICLATVYSVYLLMAVSEIVGLSSYEELGSAILGRSIEKVTTIMVVSFCWGVGVMFVVVMGDVVSPLIERFGWDDVLGRKTAMLVFWSLFMLPLSLAKQISSLRYSSFIGGASTLFLAVALAIRVFKKHVRDGETLLTGVPWARFDSSALSAMSTYLFSYCCQPVVFLVRSEMRNGSAARMTLCATYAMTGCTLIYVCTGFLGLLAYGGDTQPNILSNLAAHLDEVYVQLAVAGMATTVTLVFPLTMFPPRESILLAMGYQPRTNPCPAWVLRSVAAALAVSALLTGMWVPSIRVLVDLLGGLFGGSLSFLLPGLFAVCCGAWTVSEVGLLNVLGAWSLVFLGASMCIIGTYCSVKNSFFT